MGDVQLAYSALFSLDLPSRIGQIKHFINMVNHSEVHTFIYFELASSVGLECLL